MLIQSIYDCFVVGYFVVKDDIGFLMIEVIIVFFVFIIFIFGFGYLLLLMIWFVGDDENCEVVVVLVFQEIDCVCVVLDFFNVFFLIMIQMVNGIVFMIKCIVGWVIILGFVISCGSLGGNLQDKVVDVQVIWVK